MRNAQGTPGTTHLLQRPPAHLRLAASMTAPTEADTAALTHLYQNMCARADAHTVLDVEPELDGLTPRERAFIELGVDIGWTATIEELADQQLLAGGETE
jgi:hypothetical protein